MQRKSRFFHHGFILFEALFCLFLTSFSLLIFGFYLSIPKFPIYPQNLIYPTKIISESEVILQSRGLMFKAKYQELQEGEDVYFSFEAES